MSSQRLPTEYERYLRVPELLALQKPGEARAHHDELLFQIVHQVEELWMKLALEELALTADRLDRNQLAQARYSLARIFHIEQLMTHQFRLIEQMLPSAYFAVRAALGRGSGQESPGFNALLRELPKLWPHFAGALDRGKVTLLEIHKDPDRHPELLEVAEAMIDIDEGFQTFRYHHVTLVKRIIGHGTPSLKGKPTELLEASMKTQLFPALWEVREEIFALFVPGPAVPTGHGNA
ncbi:MAG: tryptophan 2,3-dioxygenase family protein [Polyangiales bacterium]